MNKFKSYIRGVHGGGRACSCCVDHNSKQVTRRWARHRLKHADRMEFINMVDEDEPEVFSDPTPEGPDEDPFREPDVPDWLEDHLREFEVPDWTEDDDEFADDYWEDLFWANEILWWSRLSAA